MPRIKNLKDQQLYRVEKGANDSVFAPLLTKIADLAIIEEQWDEMTRLALSLKERTAPAHVIVRRLTNSYPSDRLSKAITNLGRIIKTEYILLCGTSAHRATSAQQRGVPAKAPAPDLLRRPRRVHHRGLGGWGTMERKRTLRGSGREFDTIAGCL